MKALPWAQSVNWSFHAPDLQGQGKEWNQRKAGEGNAGHSPALHCSPVPHAASGGQSSLQLTLLCISFCFFPLACSFANSFPPLLCNAETLFWSHPPEPISEVISLHYLCSFIHISENMVWSRLPRNLRFLPQARMVTFVTAHLGSPDKSLLGVQSVRYP